MGLEKTRVIHRIVIDPFDPNTVYVGATGSAWGPSETRGVFKTNDGGKSWDKVLYVNEHTGVADMVIDPGNHKKLLVAMWHHRRTPWDFKSGGAGSGLYLTFDGGENWKKLTDKEGLPKGELGRIGVAFAQNKPNIVYALVEAKKNGFYKSTDGGSNWSLVSTKNIGNRPFYYSEIYVDPSNENRIWNLWTFVSKSEDAGRTFEVILDYGKGVHPDHHAFWQSPDDPNYLIDGNDGGLNISRDGGQNWRFVTNIPAGQFYHVNIDMDYPYHVYGGMQDNGSWVGPAYVLKNGGVRNADWREVMFGDGFDIMPQKNNNRYLWAASQGGSLGYVDKETGSGFFAKPVHPEGVYLRYNWNAALAQDPFNDCGVYYGSQFVHHSTDCGKSWEILSPDLTTNDTTKQKQDISGGLTMDATQAENHTTIIAIAPSPVDQKVIWVGTDDGNLQVTTDGGETWTNVNHRLPGCAPNAWIPQIEVSQTNAGEAFVVVNNYRQNDWTPFLYHTTDFGNSFKRLVDESDVHSFVCSVVQDPVQPNLLFLGADDGLYFSINAGTDWQKWPSKSFPSVQVRDMKIHPRENDLVLGTFGRAFWVMDDLEPLREIAATQGKVMSNELAMFNSPDGYLSNYRSVDGIRFTADAEFRGQNRSRGARMTIWKGEKSKGDGDNEEAEPNNDEEDEDEVADDDSGDDKADESDKKKSGKPTIHVIDSQGDTIRTFTTKLKEGFNQVRWNMSRDGVRFPSRRDPPDDGDKPSGRRVLPGSYKIVCQVGDVKDSTEVVVRMDPRVEITEEMLAEKDRILEEFEGLVQQATDGFEQLKNAQKNVKLINTAIVNAPDSTQKMVKEKGKEISKQIDELMEIYMLPEDTKGIAGTSTKLTRVIGTASGYLNRTEGPPGPNGLHAVENAQRELRAALQKINAFVEKDWNAYREAMKGVEFNLFKPVSSINKT